MTRPLEERFGFATFFVGQIVAVAEEHEILERHRLADGFKVRQPFLHRGQIGGASVPGSVAANEIREGSERNKVQRELAVRIDEDAAHGVAQFRRTPGIRPTIEAATVVVVRVEIIPEERLAAEEPLQFLNVRNSDVARNDFRPSPEDIDLGQQLAANRLQIVFTAQPTLRHSPAVRRGTKKKARTRRTFAGPPEQSVRNVTLSRGEGAERVPIRCVHPVGDVVE